MHTDVHLDSVEQSNIRQKYSYFVPFFYLTFHHNSFAPKTINRNSFLVNGQHTILFNLQYLNVFPHRPLAKRFCVIKMNETFWNREITWNWAKSSFWASLKYRSSTTTHVACLLRFLKNFKNIFKERRSLRIKSILLDLERQS